MTVSLDLQPLKQAVSTLLARLDEIEEANAGEATGKVSIELGYLRVSDIVRAVAYETGQQPVGICGARRIAPLLRARSAVCWLARNLTSYSLEAIGLVLGGRDHSTIVNAIGRAEAMRARDPAFRMLTDRLLSQFTYLKEH